MDKDQPGHLTQSSAKGRGTGYNKQSRYIEVRSVAVDDGWLAVNESNLAGLVEGAGEKFSTSQSNVATKIYADRTKTLITKNSSPDISFSQSINPYKGCEHGCIYCFARPTHAYLDLSPGLDFESKIFRKTNIEECLLRELSKPSYVCSTIAMGTNTDPYQPAEKEHKVTRQILRLLSKFNHPVSIVTKSTLILRDKDLLADMAERGLVHVHISVTTLSNQLKVKLEPRTAGPGARLRTIKELRAAGIPVGALVAPVIPFINDSEIEDIVYACVDHGAQDLGYILLRLPLEVKPLFERWLEEHFPLKADRVMSAVRNTRRGRAYEAEWHKRMVGHGAIAELIKTRFLAAQRRAGIVDVARTPLRTDLFEIPYQTQGRGGGVRVRVNDLAKGGQQSLF